MEMQHCLQCVANERKYSIFYITCQNPLEYSPMPRYRVSVWQSHTKLYLFGGGGYGKIGRYVSLVRPLFSQHFFIVCHFDKRKRMMKSYKHNRKSLIIADGGHQTGDIIDVTFDVMPSNARNRCKSPCKILEIIFVAISNFFFV